MRENRRGDLGANAHVADFWVHVDCCGTAFRASRDPSTMSVRKVMHCGPRLAEERWRTRNHPKSTKPSRYPDVSIPECQPCPQLPPCLHSKAVAVFSSMANPRRGSRVQNHPARSSSDWAHEAVNVISERYGIVHLPRSVRRRPKHPVVSISKVSQSHRIPVHALLPGLGRATSTEDRRRPAHNLERVTLCCGSDGMYRPVLTAMQTPTMNPNVGPTTFTWHGF